MAHCEICDMDRAYCIHGNPPSAPPVTALERNGPTIAARFTGSECVGCGGRIHEGEEITMTHDGWAHAHEVDEPGPDSTFEGVL